MDTIDTLNINTRTIVILKCNVATGDEIRG